VITDHLKELVAKALERIAAKSDLRLEPAPEIEFERPRRREHGDWATNVALSVAAGRGNPRAIAEEIAASLPGSDFVERVEVAGPGFLNFHLSPAWLQDVVRRAADLGSGFGRTRTGEGQKVNVEYVSANPTGPINVVSGRHAALGDAIARLLAATGHEVTREFYINDRGRQIRLFAESVAARYLQHFGRDAELPEDGYQGEYLIEVAKEIASEKGEALIDAPEDERTTELGRIALDKLLEQMKESLGRFGTHFDVWFSEQERLHESGAVDKTLAMLEEQGAAARRDDALWFLATKFGDDKDRVLVRSGGAPTYLASDAAYLVDKFSRGFDMLIYLWGADHHGTIARVLGVAEALGFDRERVEISIVQVVTLKRGDSAVKGSKRAGVIVLLDDLVDEVGADAARYTFLTRSIDAPLEFDIALAKEHAPDNPVYYVQYAHARICSILRKAEDEGAAPDVTEAPLERLEHEREDELMRKLAFYEEVIPDASALRAPQRVTRYVEELASVFSGFYRDCRVISEDAGLTNARLSLCLATKNVISDALGLLGVRAPERM
jgi:arginyl-tRNA synthetase